MDTLLVSELQLKMNLLVSYLKLVCQTWTAW